MHSFEEKVLSLTAKIPKGRVSTYCLIASYIGSKKAYRAVGNALNKNKNLLVIPCHRIVRSNGKIGGYATGTDKKKEILINEGVGIKGDRIVDFDKILFKFN